MRSLPLALLLLAAAASAQQPLADGCVVTPASCNSTFAGRLAAGDCTQSDGTFYDLFRFAGSARQLVIATVYPVSSMMTRPSAIMIPPPGDASDPPYLFGGKAVEVAYDLSSSGAWTLRVGTNDLFAGGDYVVSLFCRNPSTAQPQSCVDQNLLCGQEASWYLTSQSCRFIDNPNRLYARFKMYGVAGDLLDLSLLASDFKPLIGIYDPVKGGAPLAVSQTVSSTEQRLIFAVPTTKMYDVLVTSQQDLGVGFFHLAARCSVSGCLRPLLLSEPADVAVPYGARATLTASAAGVGGLQYNWIDRNALPVPVGSGATFTTPPVTARQTYSVTVSTPCGSVDSRVVTVTPAAARHRAVSGR